MARVFNGSDEISVGAFTLDSVLLADSAAGVYNKDSQSVDSEVKISAIHSDALLAKRVVVHNCETI